MDDAEGTRYPYVNGTAPVRLDQATKSRYFRGLLVLLRRDRIIDIREKDLVLQIGEILGFDQRFCEATIEESLSNINLTREPVFFPDQRIKECFLRDALRVALVDGNLHPAEFRWLRKVAKFNGLKDQWLKAAIKEIQEKKGSQNEFPFEIQRHL
jgi:hypothetical protein